MKNRTAARHALRIACTLLVGGLAGIASTDVRVGIPAPSTGIARYTLTSAR